MQKMAGPVSGRPAKSKELSNDEPYVGRLVSDPPPLDDGAAEHLRGLFIASVTLRATNGLAIDLSALTGKTVIYAYPMTGRPGVPLPEGWDMLPGARGCTPQSCTFRDHYAELRALGVDHLFGLSS